MSLFDPKTQDRKIEYKTTLADNTREEQREWLNKRFDSVTKEGHVQSCGEYQTAIDETVEFIQSEITKAYNKGLEDGKNSR